MYCIKVKIGIWNVVGCFGVDKDLVSWFVSGKGVDKSFLNLDFFDNFVIEYD